MGPADATSTTMDKAVENLEEKMRQTDERLDDLALQMGNIENEIFSEDGEEIEVNNLLRSVHEVKNNYQNMRKELMEVQDLQKQLSTSLQFQLKVMQSKFNKLKEKIGPPPGGSTANVGSPSSRSSSTTTTQQ